MRHSCRDTSSCDTASRRCIRFTPFRRPTPCLAIPRRSREPVERERVGEAIRSVAVFPRHYGPYQLLVRAGALHRRRRRVMLASSSRTASASWARSGWAGRRWERAPAYNRGRTATTGVAALQFVAAVSRSNGPYLSLPLPGSLQLGVFRVFGLRLMVLVLFGTVLRCHSLGRCNFYTSGPFCSSLAPFTGRKRFSHRTLPGLLGST